MTDFVIPVVWPAYPISTPSGEIGGLGHAGVVIVDGNSGATNYFDYGRYRDSDGDGIADGWVRDNIPVANLTITDGRIDGLSLQSMIGGLNSVAGKETVAVIAVLPLGEGGYEDAVEFAQAAHLDPEGVLGPYEIYPSVPFIKVHNTCYTFVKDVASAGGSWIEYRDGFGIFDNAPSAGIMELVGYGGGYTIGVDGNFHILSGGSSYVLGFEVSQPEELQVHMSQKNLLSSTSPLLLVDNNGETALISTYDGFIAWDTNGDGTLNGWKSLLTGQESSVNYRGRTPAQETQAENNWNNLKELLGIGGGKSSDGASTSGSGSTSNGKSKTSSSSKKDKKSSSSKDSFDKRDLKDSEKNGTKNTTKKPIILDLDGDGIQITELSQSNVFLDANNDGLENRIAWAAAGNGVLFYDANGDGEITETREFVFTEWDPTAKSDLEAIASVFDTNGDGVLDASDDAYADFKVMITNADGTFEVKTLAELGITSIDLTGDATHIELPDGSVITGQSTFTWADGTTGTVGDVQLSYDDESHRVEQTSATDVSGNLVLTSTGYGIDGAVAFEHVSVVSPDGKLTENTYDDNGDGVVDRLQSIAIVDNADGTETKTVSNSVGSDAATAILVNQTVTHTDGDVVTISRDSTGGGWFDQIEVRTTHADESVTITIEELSFDGSVIQSTVETVSANGLLRTEIIDRDGDGGTDLTITHQIVENAGGSRTEATSYFNADGSLRSKTVETVSADGKTKSIDQDMDADGAFETTQDLDITVNADESTTSIIEIENADGSIRSTITQTQSDDALSKTIETDADGDSDIDSTVVDATVINADGSRDHTVTVSNGDSSTQSMVQESLGADQVTYEMWVDQNQNGVFEATDLVKSVTVDATSEDRTTMIWDRNADGSVKATSTSVASADGLSVTTTHDVDGDGDVDATISDVTVVNANGSTTRTVSTHNQDGSLQSRVTTDSSSDGLSVTTTSDIDGDGLADAVSNVVQLLNADGSTTRTTSQYAGDGTTLLSSSTRDESADRRQVTESSDTDGDGINDLIVVSNEADDGSVVVTKTGYFDDGTVSFSHVSTISADGLIKTTTSDADGDGISEGTVTDTTVLNSDGSQTQTISTENGDGSLRSRSITTISDDGMVVTSAEDTNGDGVYERQSVTTTSFGTDGSTTTITENKSSDGSILNREMSVVSDDGLTITQSKDSDGDGTYDLLTTSTTTLLDDGGFVEVTELRDSAGALRNQVTVTQSDNGRNRTVESDLNGDGHIDRVETFIEADDGTVTTNVTDFALGGTVESSSQKISSDTGLAVQQQSDLDGDGVVDQIVDRLTTNNADGSTTTVTETTSANGTLISASQVDVSDDGLSTTTQTDIDGDGVAEYVKTETTELANNGAQTQTTLTHAADGSLLSSLEQITSADGNTVTRTSDLDGNGFADDATVITVAADGSSKTTSTYFSEGGGVEAIDTQVVSGDGLDITSTMDRNGDGRVELRTLDKTELSANGQVHRSVEYLDEHYRSLGEEAYFQSDDGLTSSISYDLDGDGVFDRISESETVFEADGDIVTIIKTLNSEGDVIASEVMSQSGDGLQSTIEADVDGDGGFDRLDVTNHGAAGGYTRVIREFGVGAELASSTTLTVSADGFSTLAELDINGDGHVDQDYHTLVEADQSITSTYRDLSSLGHTQSEIVSKTSANGFSTTTAFDVDGDGAIDFMRETLKTIDADGNQITTFSEKAEDGTVIYQEVTNSAANGFSNVTTFDVNGDGVAEGTRTITTKINDDGSQDVSTQTLYTDGSLRAKADVHTSSDGRSTSSSIDYDGNGIADKTSTQTISSDGEQIVVTKSFGEAGVLNSTFTTTTSADGLTVTTIRDSATGTDTIETTTYAAAGSGSYTWDNGAVASTTSSHQTSSHSIDANGVDTWSFVEQYRNASNNLITNTFTAQLDEAAKNEVFEAAAKLYDSILDRDLDSVEREELVRFVEDGHLDVQGLASTLLSGGEFASRYGTLSDAEFITQLYLNSFERAPSMMELASDLAALSGDTDPWSGLYDAKTRIELAADLAQSSEHIVIGNGHMSTNNFDVIMNPAVYERFLDRAYVEAMVTNLIDVAYDRDPTAQELSHLTDLMLKDTDTAEDIVSKLLDVSGEIFGETTSSLNELSGVDLVNQAFENAFSRLPTPQELNTWANLLNGGSISKAQFIASLAQSAEHLAVGNVHELGDAANVTTHAGGAGSETINGGDEVDVFVGTAGDDTLQGGDGSDIYHWSKGDGPDTFNDASDSRLETDTLVFGDVISSDVSLTRAQGSDNLVLTVLSTGEVLTLKDQFEGSTIGDGFEAIEFSDGVTWDFDSILANTTVIGDADNNTQSGLSSFDDVFKGGNGADDISGGEGDDLLIGGLAHDDLDGGIGDDTYVWEFGDGNDEIHDTGAKLEETDRLVLADVTSDQVTLTKDPDSPNDLRIEIANQTPNNGTQGALYFEFYDTERSVNTIAEIPTSGAEGLGLTAVTDVHALAEEYGNDTKYFGVRFFGTITIAAAGTYTFDIGSDDGSKLWIDGSEIVDNDGAHGFETESGSVTLGAGTHTIEFAFFEITGDDNLVVGLSGPDTGGELMELFESGILGDASGANTLINEPPANYTDFFAPATVIKVTDQFLARNSGVGI